MAMLLEGKGSNHKIFRRIGSRWYLEYYDKIYSKCNDEKIKNVISILREFREGSKRIIETINRTLIERPNKPSITIRLENLGIIFDVDDEILRESLIRKTMLILQRAFIGVDRVRNIDVSKNGYDIIININLY